MTDETDRPDLTEQRGVEEVYQPAADSRLLADVACEHVEASDLVLDVGTGSGYVADRLHGETGATVVGSDPNPLACREAVTVGLPVVRGDLVTPFDAGAFDVVCFNPPYLPTPPDEEWGDWMSDALSGGEDGRAVIEPFLDTVPRVLATDGAVFLLVSTLTDPDAVADYGDSVGFCPERVRSESHPFERLVVFRLARPTDD